jgi:L-glyceraldehyde 3-phosphate reductase
MEYRYCGRTGLKLSVITLGLMVRDCSPGAAFDSVRDTILAAMDAGVTSIDLAVGYGGGAVERAFGKILSDDLPNRREHLVIATKGGWADGSRKTLTSHLERSLRQLQMDCVDLYYHHAPDAHTPYEETVEALAQLVRQGKTRYVGISNYSPSETVRMTQLCHAAGLPLAVHQPNYNMLNRWVEDGLLDVLDGAGMGAAVFSPLSQGLLSDAGVHGPRAGSRAAGTLKNIVEGTATGERAYGKYADGDVKQQILTTLGKLNGIAKIRGQTLSQLALAWVLRHPTVATAIVGTSSVEQLKLNAAAADKLAFTDAERQTIANLLPPRWGKV